MSNNLKEPIIPLFKAMTSLTKVEILGSLDYSFQTGVEKPIIIPHNKVKIQPKFINEKTLEISLDNGTEWYNMERLVELLELGLETEYAIDQLKPPEVSNE